MRSLPLPVSRSRTFPVAPVVLALLGVFAAAGRSSAQNLYVTGGTAAGNTSPVTYDEVQVSGTDAGGNPSTYTADAPFLASYLSILDSGVFNANANVQVSGNSSIAVQVSAGGRLNLNSGTFFSTGLFASGGGAISRPSGGTYDVTYLSVYDGATLNYSGSDRIGYGLYISGSGASVTLDKDLDLASNGGYLNMGSGGMLDLNGHRYSVDSLYLSDSSLTYSAPSSITANVQLVDAQLTLAQDLLLSNTNGSSSSISVSGTAGALVTGAFHYAASSLSLSGGPSLAYRPGDAITDDVSVQNGSTLTLDGANMALAGALSLSGSGSLVRAGSETVSAESLSLADGAAFTYLPGDSIRTYVNIAGGGQLTLGQDLLLLTNTAAFTSISMSGSGSALDTGSFHYSATSLTLQGGPSLTYRSGDTITDNVSVWNGSTLTLDGANLSLAGYLYLSGSGSLVRAGSETVSASSLTLVDADFTYGPGDSITSSVSLNGGRLTLGQNLVLTSTTGPTSISVSGPGSELVTGSFNYAANSLTLQGGPSLTYRPGDSITDNVTVSDGSTLTLDGANLSLTGNLFLAGSGAGSGSLVRTSETVSAASLSLANGAALTYRTGDSITTTVAISGGGRLTLGQDLLLLTNTAAYTSILVSGSGSELVTGSFHYSANSLTLDGGPSLTYRPGDSITDYLSVGNGSTLTLDGANLSLAGYLALSGSGSLVRTSETVSAAGLDLYYGASLTLGSGDVIRNISIYGGSLTATTPLALDSLSMYSGLLLLSNNFTGTGGPRPWGLALTGSNTSLLESYLSQNLIQFTGVAQVGVLYDSVSNMTYVMAVPEPSTLIFTGIGLTAVGATARRRRRRKSNR